jgi:hypothetical protein
MNIFIMEPCPVLPQVLDPLLVAARQDRQGPVFGRFLGARHRGVHQPDGGGGQFFTQLQREAGGHRAHVDEDLLRAEGLGGAVRAEEQFIQGLGARDHGDDDGGVLGQGFGAGGHPGPQPGQGFGLGRGAVINDQGIPGPEDIGGHGGPHDAQTHKTHFRFHSCLSFLAGDNAGPVAFFSGG